MLTRLKKQLHKYAHYYGVSTHLARNMNSMRILMYHGVGGHECPAEEFERQLAYLTKYFSIVPLDEIIDRLNNQEHRSGLEIALTFDDGLRNNFTIAYPILRKFNLPATFFVCPLLIESGQWLWNHEARQRLKHLDDQGRRGLSMLFGTSLGTTEQVVEWMKTIPLARRKEVQEYIKKITPFFKPTSEESRNYDIMTWKELASMSTDLITVGAHTSNHDILDSLEENILTQEITGCGTMLEDVLQRTIDYFCYPNGVYNSNVVRKVRGAYRAAVTTDPGVIKVDDDIHLLNRIGVSPDISDFTWRLHRPGA